MRLAHSVFALLARKTLMNRIDARFAELRRRGEAALIPFITAGDPDMETTLKVLMALERGGADCAELGIPFSDPMADGLTIQRSSERALKKGASLPLILEMVREFRRKSEMPLILFGYYNPFYRFGLERFTRKAKAAGVDGVLCVDLPPEEGGELRRCTRAQGLDSIFLLAPTSDAERIRLVAERGRGFIYYVSVTGVTGARKSFEDRLPAQVARIRRYTSLPVGVGFGIWRGDGVGCCGRLGLGSGFGRGVRLHPIHRLRVGRGIRLRAGLIPRLGAM